MAAIDWNSDVVAALVAVLAAIGLLSVLGGIALLVMVEASCARARRARARRDQARPGVVDLGAWRMNSCAPSGQGRGAVRRGGGRDRRQGGRT